MNGVAPATKSQGRSLDLPGVLPLLAVAATWELLLKRVVGHVIEGAPEGGIRQILATLVRVGTFTENLAMLLSLVLFTAAVARLLRQPSLGPIPHRVTICGFAAMVGVITALGWLVPIGADTAVLAHAAAVLLVLLISLGIFWNGVPIRLMIGTVLLLLPTLLRGYTSLALSFPLLRTETAIPLYIFRAAELVAVLAAIASPWLLAGISPLRFVRRPPLIAMGLASLPALAFAAALTEPNEQVEKLCLAAVGFELWLPVTEVIYPVALFFFLLTVAVLVLPGLGRPRSQAEQRVGYGITLLFLAGLDGLWETVTGLGFEPENTPALIQFLLEGNWRTLTAGQQAMVGPPLRDLYQVLLMAYGYVLLLRGVLEQGDLRQDDEKEEP